MAEKNVSSVRTHKIKIKKPFSIEYKQKIVCPYCNNSEDFYEVIENATFLISYIQNADGTLEPIEEEIEVLGPVKFFCGICNADLTQIKKKYKK
ncbi:MAG: hypothetical protein OD816_000144 [Thermodesulfobacterium sp.]|uniref:Uncharacterized protein n=1 Tax=Candidatus Thermodesulfobacterium syntrophicum TaxID=3060442 RepID=A0AAE3TDG7_9BACT|nr:hypothetical protein [Candidatus Thermodesulfobacterium syntrophicum]